MIFLHHEERSRIRSWIRIRSQIHYSEVRSVPKCHGSPNSDLITAVQDLSSNSSGRLQSQVGTQVSTYDTLPKQNCSRLVSQSINKFLCHQWREFARNFDCLASGYRYSLMHSFPDPIHIVRTGFLEYQLSKSTVPVPYPTRSGTLNYYQQGFIMSQFMWHRFSLTFRERSCCERAKNLKLIVTIFVFFKFR